MNKVILIGNTVSKDVGYYADDRVWCRLRLAVDKRYSDEADFFDVKCFGKTAELCNQYVDKGKRVAVEGFLSTGKYDKDGVTIHTLEVIASTVEFL